MEALPSQEEIDIETLLESYNPLRYLNIWRTIHAMQINL